MVEDTEVRLWKPDPYDRRVVHSVWRVQFGKGETHCGVTISVERMRNEPPGRNQRTCDACYEARQMMHDFPRSAWDTGTDYGPR